MKDPLQISAGRFGFALVLWPRSACGFDRALPVLSGGCVRAAALYDVALFGEWPDLWSELGIAIIVAGAMLLAWRERRLRERSAPARR